MIWWIMRRPVSRQEIIDAAMELEGVPWKHQGRSTTGVDCIGLLRHVAVRLELTDYDVAGYRRTPGLDFVKRLREAGLRRKPMSERKTGDVMIFRDGTQPMHVGFLVVRPDGEWILHSTALHRKVMLERYGHELVDNALHCWQMPGVED